MKACPEKPAWELTYHDYRTDKKLVVDCYPSNLRSDRYRVHLNGKPWLKLAGLSQIMAELRKRIGRGGHE